MPHDLIAFRRGDPGYEAARRAASFNARLPDRFPEIIVQAQDQENVVAAVALANANGWTIGVRSGGHSWAANHIRDGGMLLDVSRLNRVEIDEAAMIARVGPGCEGNAINSLLAKRKLFFPVGHCESVCLGGYLLQGGFGWNSRVVGNACANVVGIDYVGADGIARHASAEENPDMFWAARGAGPGFFAVVTRFHLKLTRRPRVIGAKAAFYGIEHLDTLVRWAHEVGPRVPDSIELMMLVSRKTDFVKGAGITVVAPIFANSLRQAWRDLAFMKTLPPGATRRTPFLPTTVKAMTRQVMGHYPAGWNYAVDNMWTHASAEALLPGIRRIADSLPVAPSHMLWMNWAPPTGRPDMAYSLDDQTYIALYGVWKDEADTPTASTWARENMAAMSPLSTGVQLADENLGARPAPFLAEANMARLDALRAKHDPDGRFHPYMGRV